MKIFYTFVLLVYVILSFSCKAKKDEEYININEKDKHMLPYSGFDTLTFIRTTVGDTHIFIGTGLQTGFDNRLITSDPGGIEHYEKYSFKYISKTINTTIEIGQHFPSRMSDLSTFLLLDNTLFEGTLNFGKYQTDLDSLNVLGKTYKRLQIIPDVKSIAAYFDSIDGCVKINNNYLEQWELLSIKK